MESLKFNGAGLSNRQFWILYNHNNQSTVVYTTCLRFDLYHVCYLLYLPSREIMALTPLGVRCHIYLLWSLMAPDVPPLHLNIGNGIVG